MSRPVLKATAVQTGAEVPVYLVRGGRLPVARRLVHVFRQEGALYSGPETEGEAALLRADGTLDKLGPFDPSRVAWAFGGIVVYTVRFRYLPQSWTEALIIDRVGHRGAVVRPPLEA